jgi:CubicO group peptidase (beta-lactamase class C family)
MDPTNLTPGMDALGARAMSSGRAVGHGAMSFEQIRKTLDAHVASGRVPGYVAAVRIRGETAIYAGGRMAVDRDSPPMREDTLFRIASVTKPIGGALTLALVEDGVVALDDPIARWLPELERPRVLVAPDAALDDTVDAVRPITVRDLLACTAGWGAVMQPTPLQAAMVERGVYPGSGLVQMPADEFVAQVASLPLAFQPGDGWLYDTPIEVLGVLLARATGRSLSDLVAERITGPLGMSSTAFGARDVERLATAYTPNDGRLEVADPPDGQFAGPPLFEELSSGLVSSAPDLLRFYGAMADGGTPVMSPESLALMTADALTDAHRARARPILGPGESWGLATGIDIAAERPWQARGRWGWTGGTGTTAYVDPVRGTVSVLLTQREMTGPQDGPEDFWTAVAEAA